MNRSPNRVHISLYVNAKGEHRVGITISRDMADRVAVGDTEAADALVLKVAERIQRVEGVPTDAELAEDGP